MSKRYVSLLIAGLVVLAWSPVHAQMVGFVNVGSETEGCSMYSIDIVTGAGTLIGDTGVGNITSAAFDPTTGITYAGHGGGGCCPTPLSGCLLTADTATGAVTTVGCDPVYGGAGTFPGLAINSAGEIFGMLLACNAGIDDCNTYLSRINKTTGAITIIGQSGTWNSGNGMAFGPGDVLYFFDTGQGLGTLNLGTGAFTPIPGWSFNGFPDTASVITDMTYDVASGTLYATVSDHGTPFYLATINPSTGAIDYVSTLPGKASALVFDPGAIFRANIPTVGTWGVIVLSTLLLIAGMLAIRRRSGFALSD